MKKNSCLMPFVTIVLLFSCSPSDESSLGKDLEISCSKTNFYQYDRIDFQNFSLKDKSTGKEIEDFQIQLDERLLEDDKSRIFRFGDVSLSFLVSGYQAVNYTINVQKSTALDERMEVRSQPDKTTYAKGETFDPKGLKILYSISYTRGDNTKVKEKEETAYSSIVIDGVDASNYVFGEENYSKKYAIIQGHNPLGEPLYCTVALNTEDTTRSSTTVLDGKDEQYQWTSNGKTMKVRFKNSNATLEKSYYSPEEINLNFDINSLCDLDASNFKGTPTKGEVPLLVVPVVLNGMEEVATEENRAKLEKGFFGPSGKDGLPPSLSSFYYYSSYKQLRFVGEVTPYFNPTKEGYFGYSNPYSFNIGTPQSLAQDALDWVKKKTEIHLDDYDSDNDGYVDGVWLVYMEDIHNSLTINVQNPFWPFTGNATLPPGDKENPVLNTFAWVGLTHLWGNYADSDYVSKIGFDPHVIEHETGHMLGLSDYYSYSSSSTADGTYSPLGKLDLMDRGFGDHNPYSKMLLGWSRPYLILDDCEIEIPSSQLKDSFFLLPYDAKTYAKDSLGRVILNPFDEYLILDYYSYENFYQDLYHDGNLTYAYPNASGGRLYHVDGRILKFYDDEQTFELPSDPDFLFHYAGMAYRCITNSQSGSRSESSFKVSGIKDYFDEIRLISKDKRLINGTSNLPNIDSLFVQGDRFSLADYANQFYYGGKLDNEKDFSIEFEIVNL